MKNNLKGVYEYIDENFERYIEEIRDYLRTTGVSYTGEGIEETAEATAQHIRAIGGEAKLVPIKGGYPVVYGKLRSANPKAKTILYYSHYDVVQVTPEEWTFPPFAAEIVNAEEIELPAEMGKVIVARAAHDKKGPILGVILALGAIKEVLGDVPVNVIFLIEGEEEIASPNLRKFVDEYYEELRKADAWYDCGSFRQFPSGLLVIHPGTAGGMIVDLEIKGGAWGGTTDGRGLWSAYVSFVDQPLLRLVHAISTMINRDGEVLIEGFYDNWIPPTPEERVEIEKTKELIGETTIMRDLANVERFKGGLPAEEFLEDYLTAPHIVPVGISSGYKEDIPMKATARLYCRFVPNLSSEEILQKIRRHLYKYGFPEIEAHTTRHVEWSRSPISEDIVRALVRMAEIHGIKYVIWPTPAFGPVHLFTRSPLNLPMVYGGLGHGGHFHAADEYITVEGVRDHMKGIVTFLHEYAYG